jgi:hypothetical protein
MSSRPFRLIALSFCFALPLVVGACTSTGSGAAGGPGFAWFRGAFEGNVDGTTSELTRAAEQALRDLDMKHIEASSTEIDGKVTGRSALDKEVKITIKRTTDKVSWVSVRVGSFGDEALSQRIFEMIRGKS